MEQDQGASIVTLTAPVREEARLLPQWKVLLHNDDINDVGYVADTICELTRLTPPEATLRTDECHKTGVALLVTTHREHAELLEEQFESKRLVVTIEPD